MSVYILRIMVFGALVKAEVPQVSTLAKTGDLESEKLFVGIGIAR
jgi:hypothetical protein